MTHKPGYQLRKMELRKWFVSPSDTDGLFLIVHRVGTPDCDFIEWGNPHEIKPQTFTESEAHEWAHYLNTQPVPETYTYSEWRE